MNKIYAIFGPILVLAIAVIFILQFQAVSPTSVKGGDSGPMCAVDVRGACLPRTSYQASYRLLGSRADASRLRSMGFGKKVAARQVVFDTGVSTGDYPRGYTVTTSADGVNWSTAASGQGTGQLTVVNLAGTGVRYVRMTLTASSGSWWSVADVRAYTR